MKDMNEIWKESVYFGVGISILGYAIGEILKKKYKFAIFNPLLIGILVVIGILLTFRIDYQVYKESAKYLTYLLTPATVCLAIPLYQQLDILKKNLKAVLIGIISGVLSSLTSILAFAFLFSLTHEQYVTLLPKSITTAIAIGITEELGGITTVTIAVIVVTGLLGNLLAESICKLARIQEPIAVGLAIGTSAHAVGTARALELGEIQGAMSSLAVAVAGLLTVVGASVFANFL
jgi:predicted murein hydrolase (TIGR00659 family)